MKAPWPCILLAIATSSPLGRAQDRPPAPAAGAAASTAATPAPAEPAPSAPSAPTDTDPSAPAAPPEGAAPEGEAGAAEAPPAPASSGPSGLFAAPPPGPASPPPAAAEATPRAPAQPKSSNRGHVRLGARAGLVAPFGWVADGTRHLDVAGMGAGYGLDLAVGLSEEAMLGAYGDLLVLDHVAGCDECAPTSYGAGLFVRYHLVQGLRFDPWVSYGIGLIALGGTPPSGDGRYVGLEWMRLSFGGDWYGLRNLGLGPYLELGAGSFLEAPAGEEPGGIHFRFQMGMRIVLDIPGR